MSRRFQTLDAFRGIGAICVALMHFPLLGGNHLPIVGSAWLFVDMFFALSGFVIAHAYEDSLPAQGASFIIRRFGRLWPMHIVMLALFLIGQGLISRTGVGDLSRLPATALLLQEPERVHQWNYPSWSASVELWLYVSFVPFCCAPRRFRVAISAVGVASAIAAVAWLSPTYMATTTEPAIFRGAAGFYAGWLAYHAHRRWPVHSGSGLEAAVVSGALAFMVFAIQAPALSLLAPVVFCLLAWLLCDGQGWLSRLLAARPAQFLGQVSYSVYLLHAFVGLMLVNIVRHVMPDALDAAGALFLPGHPSILPFMELYLALIVAAAAVTYPLVEKTGQRIAARIAAKAIPAPQAKSASVRA